MPKTKDIAGHQFDRLVALYRDETEKKHVSWICLCDCGSVRSVRSVCLTRGTTKSCGCYNQDRTRFKIDDSIIGKKINGWLVKERTKYTKYDGWYYRCVRDCGCERVIPKRRIKKRQHTKCPLLVGCVEDLSHKHFMRIKRGAKDRNLEFDISKQEIWNLFVAQDKKCSITGVDIILSKNNKLQTASLDRIDSTKGYTKDNVWWVHRIVNTMKWDLPLEELYSWCQLILDKRK